MDRDWIIVDDSTGRAVSYNQAPEEQFHFCWAVQIKGFDFELFFFGKKHCEARSGVRWVDG
jgi:hypothetical protein